MRSKFLGNDLDRLAHTEFLLLDPSEVPLRPVRAHIRKTGAQPLVEIEGVTTREEAEALRWHFLGHKRDQAPPLPEGRYYVCDLIGCTVWDADTGAVLGRLKDILQATAQDVYVVARPGQRDLLFPLAPGTLETVSIETGQISVHLPEGLLEVYA